MTFKLLPHTADVRILIQANSYKDLLTEAFKAVMFQVKRKPPTISPVSRQISVSSKDQEALIVDFLNELLTQSHINLEVYTSLQIKHLSDEENSLEAVVLGSKVDGFDEDIKAVTHHDVQLTKSSKGQLETILVLDI